MADTKVIYKILHRDEWAQAEKDGVFKGAGIDLQDGFIHCSTAQQAQPTAALYFAGQDNLVLVAVETEHFTAEQLKWEASRENELFPHLFTTLDPKQILWVKELPIGPDGAHVFPSLE